MIIIIIIGRGWAPLGLNKFRMFNPEASSNLVTQPRKQGRMFHLDLGQNDGPFKSSSKQAEAERQQMSKTMKQKASAASMPAAMMEVPQSTIGPFKPTDSSL